jgi:hypothetical protein
MANQGLTTSQAAQLGAKTLWIGDIEPWMDENYIQGLFSGVSQIQSTLTYCRLQAFHQ